MRSVVAAVVAIASTSAVAAAQPAPPTPDQPQPPPVPEQPMPPPPQPMSPQPMPPPPQPMPAQPMPAQPMPAQPVPGAVAMQPPPDPPSPDTMFRVRGGLGIATYGESIPGLTFKADTQPLAQVAVDAFVAGDATYGFALQATAGTTTEVDMRAKQNGMVTQENKFKQDLYEISPRLRIRYTPRVAFELGYRFTYQRLHINDVGDYGDVLEVVQSHGVEGGIVYSRQYLSGDRFEFDAELGINHGWADNSLIDGDNFDAGGLQFALRTFRQFSSGLTLGGSLSLRQQNGSDPDYVTVMGQETMAVWPDNTTMMLVGSVGFAL